MRIIFMGTPELAVPVLEALSGDGYKIVAVYTQPDKPSGRGLNLSVSAVKSVALARGLRVFQPPSLRQDAERIASMSPDVIVVAAYAQLLPPAILSIPRYGCLNIHPSLLPRHRGPSPVVAAILAGDEVTGVSLMLMDKGMDTGPILAQEAVPILPEDVAGSLTLKLAHTGAQLLLQTLPRWVEGGVTPQPQNEDQATYSRKVVREDGEAEWHLSATELWRRVRAFQPWPGCYTRWRGRQLKLVKVFPLDEESGADPGRVVLAKRPQDNLIGVQTGAGILQLVQVQLEGKKVMTVEEFQRGRREFLGTLLPLLATLHSPE